MPPLQIQVGARVSGVTVDPSARTALARAFRRLRVDTKSSSTIELKVDSKGIRKFTSDVKSQFAAATKSAAQFSKAVGSGTRSQALVGINKNLRDLQSSAELARTKIQALQDLNKKGIRAIGGVGAQRQQIAELELLEKKIQSAISAQQKLTSGSIVNGRVVSVRGAVSDETRSRVRQNVERSATERALSAEQKKIRAIEKQRQIRSQIVALEKEAEERSLRSRAVRGASGVRGGLVPVGDTPQAAFVRQQKIAALQEQSKKNQRSVAQAVREEAKARASLVRVQQLSANAASAVFAEDKKSAVAQTALISSRERVKQAILDQVRLLREAEKIQAKLAAAQGRSFTASSPLQLLSQARQSVTGGARVGTLNADQAEASLKRAERASRKTREELKRLRQQVTLTNRGFVSSETAVLRFGSGLDKFGQRAALALKRYSAYLFPTTGLFAVINQVRQSIRAFAELEAEQTKLIQILPGAQGSIDALTSSFENLAAQSGVAASETLRVARTLAQAGFGRGNVEELQRAATLVTQATLGPTFKDANSIIDGSIAVIRQFKLELSDLGDVLDITNQFAKDFATDSSDIFEAVKRGGATFAELGGNFEQFAGLFSLLRESTRETAASLGTFFKSGAIRLFSGKAGGIFEQIQGSTGIDVSTTDNVVDRLNALSTAFSKLDKDQRVVFASQLVGVRQASRLIAILNALSENGDRVAFSLSRAGGSIERDFALRVDDLGLSFRKLGQEITAALRSFIDNDAVKLFVQTLTSGIGSIAQVIGQFSGVLAPVAGALGGVGLASAGISIGRNLVGKGPGQRLAQENGLRIRENSLALRENTAALRGATGASALGGARVGGAAAAAAAGRSGFFARNFPTVTNAFNRVLGRGGPTINQQAYARLGLDPTSTVPLTAAQSSALAFTRADIARRQRFGSARGIFGSSGRATRVGFGGARLTSRQVALARARRGIARRLGGGAGRGLLAAGGILGGQAIQESELFGGFGGLDFSRATTADLAANATGAARTSAVSGALTGAAVGAIFGPVGAAVGGLTGALIGGIQASKQLEENFKALSNSVSENIENFAISSDPNSLEKIAQERLRLIPTDRPITTKTETLDNIGRLLGNFDEFGRPLDVFSIELSDFRQRSKLGDITREEAKKISRFSGIAKQLEELETFRRTGQLPEEFANLPNRTVFRAFTIGDVGRVEEVEQDAAAQFLEARAFASAAANVPSQLRRNLEAQRRVVQKQNPNLTGTQLTFEALNRLAAIEASDVDVIIQELQNFGIALADVNGSTIVVKTLGEVVAETQRKLEDANLTIQNAFSESARIFADGIQDINSSFISASKVLESFTSGFSLTAGSVSGTRSLGVAQSLGIATPAEIEQQLSIAQGIARGFNAIKDTVGDAAIQAFRGPQSERPDLSNIEQRTTNQLTVRRQILQRLALPERELGDTANAFIDAIANGILTSEGLAELASSPDILSTARDITGATKSLENLSALTTSQLQAAANLLNRNAELQRASVSLEKQRLDLTIESGQAALKAENDRIKRLVSFGGLNENAADRNVLSGSNFARSIQRLLSFNTFAPSQISGVNVINSLISGLTDFQSSSSQNRNISEGRLALQSFFQGGLNLDGLKNVFNNLFGAVNPLTAPSADSAGDTQKQIIEAGTELERIFSENASKAENFRQSVSEAFDSAVQRSDELISIFNREATKVFDLGREFLFADEDDRKDLVRSNQLGNQAALDLVNALRAGGVDVQNFTRADALTNQKAQGIARGLGGSQLTNETTRALFELAERVGSGALVGGTDVTLGELTELISATIGQQLGSAVTGIQPTDFENLAQQISETESLISNLVNVQQTIADQARLDIESQQSAVISQMDSLTEALQQGLPETINLAVSGLENINVNILGINDLPARLKELILPEVQGAITERLEAEKGNS